jgi:formate/nitrite transporter
MLEAGVAKHHTRFDVLFFKAVLAGVMLSFGGILAEIVSGGSPGLTASNPGLVKILGGFVFPVGLVMIAPQGQEPPTSNTTARPYATAVPDPDTTYYQIMPMAVIKRVVPWWSLPLNFIIVTFGNLVGSLFFGALLVHYSGIISTAPYDTYAQTFAIHKAKDPQWHQIFLRGIGCNWLVCIAVWQAAGARDTISKIFAIWIPIWIFVACGFDHVVANMFSVPLGIMFGADLTVAYYIRKSFIASYLGNIVGALLVALPALYFYLGDYNADGLRTAEKGRTESAGSNTSDKES